MEKLISIFSYHLQRQGRIKLKSLKLKKRIYRCVSYAGKYIDRKSFVDKNGFLTIEELTKVRNKKNQPVELRMHGGHSLFMNFFTTANANLYTATKKRHEKNQNVDTPVYADERDLFLIFETKDQKYLKIFVFKNAANNSQEIIQDFLKGEFNDDIRLLGINDKPYRAKKFARNNRSPLKK